MHHPVVTEAFTYMYVHASLYVYRYTCIILCYTLVYTEVKVAAYIPVAAHAGSIKVHVHTNDTYSVGIKTNHVQCMCS